MENTIEDKKRRHIGFWEGKGPSLILIPPGDEPHYDLFQTLAALPFVRAIDLGNPEMYALAESVLSGGHGGVSGGANFFPALFVALYEAAVRRDLHRVSELQSLVMEIYLKIFMTGRHASRIIKGIKCVLELEGICSGFIAEPFRSFREPERDRIRKHLEEIKPKVAALVQPAQASRPEPLVAA